VIAGYLGSGNGFAEALAKVGKKAFGSLYADQTEKDWEDDLERTDRGVEKQDGKLRSAAGYEVSSVAEITAAIT
jgi:hypothetical protein